jgi:hypothetical protein
MQERLAHRDAMANGGAVDSAGWHTLADECGEVSHAFVATLVAAGWAEQDARGAKVDTLANMMTGKRNEETPV